MKKKVQFITITNSGYIPFTINCYKSLKRNNINQELISYCLDEDSYNYLKKNNYPCVLFKGDVNATHNLSRYKDENWKKMMYLKMRIIFENLLNSDYLCITDGDIVFENNNFLDYAVKNLYNKNVDIVYQNNGLSNKCNSMCAGFAVIKSSPLMKKLYDAKITDKFSTEQEYLRRRIKEFKIKISLLPLHLFPNGNYYYKNSKNINPYLIHFNWVSSEKKIRKMKSFGKWYEEFSVSSISLDKKINITEKTKKQISNSKLKIEKQKYNSLFGDFALKKKKTFYVKYFSNDDKKEKKWNFYREDEECLLTIEKEDIVEAYYIISDALHSH